MKEKDIALLKSIIKYQKGFDEYHRILKNCGMNMQEALIEYRNLYAVQGKRPHGQENDEVRKL